MSSVILFVVAVVFSLPGLGMLIFFAYQVLVASYGSAQPALYVALSDLALSIIIF